MTEYFRETCVITKLTSKLISPAKCSFTVVVMKEVQHPAIVKVIYQPIRCIPDPNPPFGSILAGSKNFLSMENRRLLSEPI